jgi:hypothetical protein
VVVGLLLALTLPATALAEPPTATTGRASDVGQNSATLHGTANPKRNAASAYFQYGTSRLYGLTTPATDIGSGNRGVAVTAAIGSLSPFTVHHYRLVVQYGNRLVFGKDRTFRTRKEPLGLTLTASPTRVRSGGSTTLSGTLSGTDAQGKEVRLQGNPFPFSGFADIGNAQVVDPAGNFAFPILDVFVNTQFRVYVVDKPEIGSPVVAVEVPIRVRLRVAKRVKRGKVRFRGRITPVSDNATVEIQRRFHGVWVTVGRTHTTENAAGSSFYRKRVRVRGSGRYRALVTPHGAYVPNTSAVHRVRVVRRK